MPEKDPYLMGHTTKAGAVAEGACLPETTGLSHWGGAGVSDFGTGWAAPQIMGYPMNKSTSIGKMRSHGVLGSRI